MDQPITDAKLNHLVFAFQMDSLLYPADVYLTEANKEDSRLEEYKKEMFYRVKGIRRQGVFVRHNVKRRWEKLGIWNPEWGFAGRNVQPNDKASEWKWRWEPEFAEGSVSTGFPRKTYMEQLAARAIRLRQNLRRGENAPVIPRSRLPQDVTASQAESFLISRPWFIFQLELAEEKLRYFRLSTDQRKHYPCPIRQQVIEWWKERRDWREEFDKDGLATSWKWRHESPSPEPEDLTPINNMKDSPLDTTDMDFTPSQIDDLETIERPSSEQPKGFWYISRDNMYVQPAFPGQVVEPYQPPPEPSGSLLHKPSGPPVSSLFFSSLPNLFANTRPEEEHDEAMLEENEESRQELEQNPPVSQRDTTNPPPHRPRRQLKRRLQDRVDSAQERDQPPPLPRRSARIAGMKRPAEPLPSQAASNKKPRGGAAPKAAALTAQPTARETRRKTRPVPARPPPKIETEARPKRGRGRPRKENGPSTHSAVKKTTAARTPAPARGRRRGAAATDTPAVPRRRGRPRKT